MKKMYVLLMGFLLSTAVIAADTEQWSDVVTDIETLEAEAEDIFLPDDGEGVTEFASPGVEVLLSDAVMAEIQQDCTEFAKEEAIEEANMAEFIEMCVADNVAIELSVVGEETAPEIEMSSEYAEVAVED